MSTTAANITQKLANVAGGAIKNGGGGMEKGIEILCQQAAKEAAKLAIKVHNQKTASVVYYTLTGLATLAGVGFSVFYHGNKKTLENLKIYHDLFYMDKITCIKEIAEATNRPPETVRKEILVNVKIDTQNDKIIIE